MAFVVTDSNRPQPLWQPPPIACLTASGIASEAPSLLMNPWVAPPLPHGPSLCRALNTIHLSWDQSKPPHIRLMAKFNVPKTLKTGQAGADILRMRKVYHKRRQDAMVIFRHPEFGGASAATKKIPLKNFYWTLLTHKFALSPPGNARDCFRTWEVCPSASGHARQVRAVSRVSVVCCKYDGEYKGKPHGRVVKEPGTRLYCTEMTQ